MSIDYSKSCGSRLPCGLCMITNSPCPYMVITPDVTCSTTTKVTDIPVSYTFDFCGGKDDDNA